MRSLTNETVISPNVRNKINLREMWLYRELFYFFAWRDIKVRYKQTALGISWAILQPALAALIFTLFFNRVVGISSGAAHIPYPVFAYLGLMYWTCFAVGMNTISNSLISNAGVITKVYFPRLIPPIAAMALAVVDFFFAAAVFVLILLAFQVVPGWEGIFLALPSLSLIIVSALSIGIFFAALNVKYRDVRSVLPLLTQLMLFVTPIIYPISLIPEKFRLLAYINPVTGAISSVKSGFFHQPVEWTGLAISWASAIIMMVIAIWYFKRSEKNFADVI